MKTCSSHIIVTNNSFFFLEATLCLVFFIRQSSDRFWASDCSDVSVTLGLEISKFNFHIFEVPLLPLIFFQTYLNSCVTLWDNMSANTSNINNLNIRPQFNTRRNPNNPEYTEFGIKIHKLRLTLKVQKRSNSANGGQLQQPLNNEIEPRLRPQPRRRSSEDNRGGRRRSRASSTSSSIAADSLRMLDLDSNAGSRRPVVHGHSTVSSGQRSSGTRLANWEFQVSSLNIIVIYLYLFILDYLLNKSFLFIRCYCN